MATASRYDLNSSDTAEMNRVAAFDAIVSLCQKGCRRTIVALHPESDIQCSAPEPKLSHILPWFIDLRTLRNQGLLLELRNTRSAIRSIVERTGVKIDVEDDGRINIASSDDVAAQKAIAIIQELTATAEQDKVECGDREIPRATRVPMRPGCKA